MRLLEKALDDWAPARLRPPVAVSVNLSPRMLRDSSLPEHIDALLRFRKVDPAALILEITETVIMADPVGAIRVLSRLHDMGVQLAVDDFGTGYSSLSYLRRLPVDMLKIDRSLVEGLETENDPIVESTIHLAHQLGLVVIAEGIESPTVLQRLRLLGCDGGQGWAIATPGESAEVQRWVAHRLEIES
jgi:EAL domain-containing protein (putative c-di-GMP-specific phosphodiesterase class I)